MKSLGFKVLASSGTVVALGGAGYGIHTLTDASDSVENYLKKNKLEIVSYEDSAKSEWDKAFNTYEIEKDDDELKITDREIKKGDDIKNWCQGTLNKRIKSAENSLYKKASYWCTKYETIAEKLGAGNPFETNVTTLEGKHAQLGEFKSTIESVSLRETKQTHQNGEKMKQWCEDNKKRKLNKRNKSFIDNITSHCLVSPTKIDV